MAGRDPNHWLHRLDAGEWLRAAESELVRAEEALASKQQRPGVAGARRAAGMAWNALLLRLDETEAARYGRSYMDHLKAIASDPAEAEVVAAAARSLLEAPMATNVIALGKGDTRLAGLARVILDEARRRATAS